MPGENGQFSSAFWVKTKSALTHLAQSYSQAVHPSHSWQPLPAFVSFELRLQNVSLMLPSGLHETINRSKVKETALKV